MMALEKNEKAVGRSVKGRRELDADEIEARRAMLATSPLSHEDVRALMYERVTQYFYDAEARLANPAMEIRTCECSLCKKEITGYVSTAGDVMCRAQDALITSRPQIAKGELVVPGARIDDPDKLRYRFTAEGVILGLGADDGYDFLVSGLVPVHPLPARLKAHSIREGGSSRLAFSYLFDEAAKARILIYFSKRSSVPYVMSGNSDLVHIYKGSHLTVFDRTKARRFFRIQEILLARYSQDIKEVHAGMKTLSSLCSLRANDPDGFLRAYADLQVKDPFLLRFRDWFASGHDPDLDDFIRIQAMLSSLESVDDESADGEDAGDDE